MMGANHAVGGAAAWVAVTSTAPYTLGLSPLPVASVLLGALVTAGAALLPDVDQHSSTIANAGGMATRSVAAVAGALSGGHRHGTHSLLAIAAFTFGTVMAARWKVVVPVLGLAPIGSALMLLALIAFATRAVRVCGGGVMPWVAAATVVAVVLTVAPGQLTWLPTSVLVGVVVHLLGDITTTEGVPLLWPWVPKPPRFVTSIPLASNIWKPNGFLAVPVLGSSGSARQQVLCAGLSLYTLYGIVATVALLKAT